MRLTKWAGTALQLAGCVLLAANVPASPWAYPVMAVGSLLWAGIALYTREHALALLNVGFLAVNIFGITRWLL
ncbi:MAG: hypothetical protein RJB62_1028 [Pseudomonadota bacterium]|jgi:hypothetical protein